MPINHNEADEIFPIDENDTDVMVTITLDDGSGLDCEIIVIFTVDDNDYIALMPVDGDGNPLEEMGILLYRYYEMEDGSPVLENIESKDEETLASDAFNRLLEE